MPPPPIPLSTSSRSRSSSPQKTSSQLDISANEVNGSDERNGHEEETATTRPRISSFSTTPKQFAQTTLGCVRDECLNFFPAQSQSNYKHWTARSGTLIANMLVAAGSLFFP